MVCYARPASWLMAIVTVAWLVFSGPVSHFFGTAAAMVAVLTATAGAAVAAALVFTTFMSTRHRRAAAGGCVNCRFRCQLPCGDLAVNEPCGDLAVNERLLPVF